MSEVVIQQLRDVTGLPGWRYNPQGKSYVLNISAAKMPFAIGKNMREVIQYFWSKRTDPRSQYYADAPKYNMNMDVVTAIQAVSSLPADRTGFGFTTPWGEPAMCLMVSGDVQGGPFGGPNHIAHSIIIPEEFAGNEAFLAYLRSFRAAEGFFRQIGDALGRARD